MSVDGVVLSIRSIQMVAGIFVAGVFTQNALEKSHGIIIFMGPSWGFEEGTNVNIGHFVISHEHH